MLLSPPQNCGHNNKGNNKKNTLAMPVSSTNIQGKKYKSDHKQVIEKYFILHQEKTGANPLIDEIVGANIKRLLTYHTLNIIFLKLESYYEESYWFNESKEFNFGAFVFHFDSIRVKGYKQPNKKDKICPSCGKSYYGSFCRNCSWDGIEDTVA